MRALALGFYGISVRLTSDSAPLLEELAKDFEYFVDAAPPPGRPELSLEFRSTRPEVPRRTCLGTSRWSVSGWTGARTIAYADGPVAVMDAAGASVRLSWDEPRRLRELAYLAVLSRVGEALDRKSLHRVHALGFETRGQGGLVLLPSGGGKSTLALALARAGETGFLSDDTPIVSSGGRLRAFPLRWALREDADLSGVPAALVRPFHRREHGPKRLVDVSYFRHRIKDDLPARWLIVGRPSRGKPALEPVGAAFALAPLSVNLIAGWGVPQMAEYLLRPGAGLASIAAARAAAARALLAQARCYRLSLGDDPGGAAALLAALT